MPLRKTTRDRKAPARFRPGPSADLPEDIQCMIRDVASSVAAGSKIPFAPEAVVCLEEVLEPIFETSVPPAPPTLGEPGPEPRTRAG